MGLLTSVNNLNYTLQQKEDQKEAERKKREKERQQKQEQKEIEEQLKKEIETILHDDFSKNLRKYGSNYILEYYNINKKNSLLGLIWSYHIIEKEIKWNFNEDIEPELIVKNGIVVKKKTKSNKKIEVKKEIEYKYFIQDYFNKVYYKILNEEEEIQKKNESYIYYNNMLQQQQAKALQQTQYMITQKNQKNVDINKINKSINTILIILFAIICFPVAIAIAACKNQK